MKREYDFSTGKRGPVIRQRGKTRITIHIDDDVLETFRERADAEGRGYQTMINDALRDYLADRVSVSTPTPSDESFGRNSGRRDDAASRAIAA